MHHRQTALRFRSNRIFPLGTYLKRQYNIVYLIFVYDCEFLIETNIYICMKQASNKLTYDRPQAKIHPKFV